LMRPGDVEEVLDNRLRDIQRYKSVFEDIEATCDNDWPAGMEFVLGFGKAISATMEQYINDNRHMLVEETDKQSATA